jgi:hypothetical protein
MLMGDVESAILLHEQMLADFERLLGAEHPDTLAACNNVALTYRDMGDVVRATALFERTLASCERVLGSDHPITETTRENLEATQR